MARCSDSSGGAAPSTETAGVPVAGVILDVAIAVVGGDDEIDSLPRALLRRMRSPAALTSIPIIANDIIAINRPPPKNA